MGVSVFRDLPGVEASQIRRLRRAEYDALVRTGAFDGEPLELIRGVIVRMSPQGLAHAAPIEVLTERLVLGLAGRARVRVQLPILAPDESQPEPDLAVVPKTSSPHETHPSEALLLIEVASTSQKHDRETKAPLYAEMGVPEYWLIDVEARVVEVRRHPERGAYQTLESVREGELGMLAFPDVRVDVSALFA
ncbi:MAG: Uma2 family endonuclease [Myxococcota bacterium]